MLFMTHSMGQSQVVGSGTDIVNSSISVFSYMDIVTYSYLQELLAMYAGGAKVLWCVLLSYIWHMFCHLLPLVSESCSSDVSLKAGA